MSLWSMQSIFDSLISSSHALLNDALFPFLHQLQIVRQTFKGHRNQPIHVFIMSIVFHKDFGHMFFGYIF